MQKANNAETTLTSKTGRLLRTGTRSSAPEKTADHTKQANEKLDEQTKLLEKLVEKIGEMSVQGVREEVYEVVSG